MKSKANLTAGLWVMTAVTILSARSQAADFHFMPGENSKASDKAKVEIVSPKEGEILPAGKNVMLSLKVEGFDLGKQTEGADKIGLANSKDGQHIHIIVDNGPYKPCYDASKPFDLGALAPGVHTIEAFASRSWHECVKSPDARKFVTFYVGEKKGDGPVKASDPLLTYSRPKGDYVGKDAEMVMVDFFVTNAKLSKDGYKVRVTVDGQSQVVDDWKPYRLHGLKAGEHKVKTELLDPKGNVVPGTYNSTERTITLK